MNQLLQEPTQDGSQRTWFGNVYSAIRSTASGMGVTLRHLFSKPVTLQYPEERPIVDDRYRGVHYLEQDLCIYCDACAKACTDLTWDAIRMIPTDEAENKYGFIVE